MVDIVIVGCGFIGSTLAKYFSEKFEITTIDVIPQPESLKNYKISHKIADITNYELLQKEIGNPKVIIHTAIVQIPKITEDKKLGYDVNVIGTQNLCEIVKSNPEILGMILISSWHTYGERDLLGKISEDIGYHPDNVEERSKLYALSKTIQECIVRFFDEKEDKIFGAIKIGTALGEDMPKGTAANVFIKKALSGEPITPYKHSMNRPMFYVSVNDVCITIEKFIDYILNHKSNSTSSIDHIMNVAYPKPISILDLAEIVQEIVKRLSNGKINPEISIVDKSIPEVGNPDDKNKIDLDISKIKNYFDIDSLQTPKNAIEELIISRMDDQ
ncbi:MAG: NAD-dependent epimerase/dehydratase family protein [Candidatus Nitrosopumilus sp. bin_7KS]